MNRQTNKKNSREFCPKAEAISILAMQTLYKYANNIDKEK